MTRLRRIKAAVALASASAALVVLPGHASAASPQVQQPSAAQTAAAAAACATGYVCFWTGTNYTGSKCTWLNGDPDWYSGDIKCTWAANGSLARSVYNAGTSSSKTGVAYYSGANYANRVGCTPQGRGGNFTQARALRSHQWISTACG
ncbi:peptidase inhibitor family I36 protein [Streptomyces sp. NPDC057682]|uniref:peptidase inhibitor family I36 protein n=1 Tax=Streptomyces sp. NPDC057682 TaxID=3346210 RepID=UPI00368E1266